MVPCSAKASATPAINAVAAMLTMIGLARTKPMTKPCAALISAPNASAAKKPNTTPPTLTAAMKIMALAPTSAPSENDMMFPLMVISVMPTATQPMKETVVSSESMLGFDRKPGVVSATTASTANTSKRMIATRLRRSRA
jgi:hypothetical protein